MRDSAYIDTSALAKWYFSEENSAAFTDYICHLDIAIISPLVKTEMRSLCARRRRRQEITVMQEAQVYSVFENDLQQGHLLLYPLDESIYERAVHLMNVLNTHSLRTLDALHLAIAQLHQIPQLATADETMARAAKEMKFEVKFF